MEATPRRIFLDRDSVKLFRIDYCIEAQKKGGPPTRSNASVSVLTKGDAIAAAVQAKIEALEQLSKDHRDVRFMVVNAVCLEENAGV